MKPQRPLGYLVVTSVISLSLLLTGCDALLEKLAKRASNKILNQSTLEYAQETDCTENFDKLSGMIQIFRKAAEEKKAPKTDLLSEAEDNLLIQIIADRDKQLQDLEKPQSDLESVYSQAGAERKSDGTKKILKEHREKIAKSFPQLLNVCQDSIKQFHELCAEKYSEPYEAFLDCTEFYKPRVYWEMTKVTTAYKGLPESDIKVLKEKFEGTFEDHLKKKAAEKQAQIQKDG